MIKLFKFFFIGFIIWGLFVLIFLKNEKDSSQQDSSKSDKFLKDTPPASAEIIDSEARPVKTPRDIERKKEVQEVKDEEIVDRNNEVTTFEMFDLIDKKSLEMFTKFENSTIGPDKIKIIKDILESDRKTWHQALISYKDIADYVFFAKIDECDEKGTKVEARNDSIKHICYLLEGYLLYKTNRQFSIKSQFDYILWQGDTPYFNYDMYITGIYDEDIPILRIMLPVAFKSDKEIGVKFLCNIDDKLQWIEGPPISWKRVTDQEMIKLKSKIDRSDWD